MPAFGCSPGGLVASQTEIDESKMNVTPRHAKRNYVMKVVGAGC